MSIITISHEAFGNGRAYVEPLYLSAERRQLRELKRLIASTGDRVVMSTDVHSLLAALFTQETRQPLSSLQHLRQCPD